MKVALVHDWLTGMRGGERVLEVFCEIFPGADLFTLVHFPGSVSGVIEDRTIKTSFIQKLPMVKRHYRYYLPLFPMAIEGFDLSGYDLVLSSSHCVARGVITPPATFHISYIFTPMRYIWDRFPDYFGRDRASWIKNRLSAIVAHYLRGWDSSSSNRVDRFIASSEYVAERVSKYYNRESTVVYPPVDCSRFSPSGREAEDFYLTVSAFAPYKRLDIAIKAFNITGARLKIVGAGQDEKRLKALAGPNIEFLGPLPDAQVSDLYSRCRALIFPGEEDFGITPVEAMASGRPVIAYARGGALETVVPLRTGIGRPVKIDSPTGLFFYEQTPAALIGAITAFEKHESCFDPAAMRAHALQFDRARFKERVRKTIVSMYNEHIPGDNICSKNTVSFLKSSSL